MIKTIRYLLAAAILLVIYGCAENGDDVYPSGTLEAIEVDVSSTIPGRIMEVGYRQGDQVKKGDTLVVLDTELISLQRIQAATGLQSIDAQELVVLDQREKAILGLKLAESTYGRIHRLLEEGGVTQQKLEEVQTQRDLAEKNITEIDHRVDAMNVERKKLRAALAVFNKQLKEGIILAPSNGTVLLRGVEPGEIATPGASLVRIADLSFLELRIFLDEKDLDRVKIGQVVSVLVDALEGKELNGKVTWISPEAEFTPKNVQTRDARTQLVYAVKIRIENPDGILHIGMPAEVKL
ncbi:MAG: efflux RND transporter periplasmic adaptor subunit [Candidatus Electryonea clarkiae]|nr:efflux RND transporter periplasmic adaptor subunit [Candidatus Electryonea clarkiae]MDP8287512.1 efflux RND transporter periplasmic adaptor subunit [Candidatus Electryonea clarkiae]